MEWADVVLVAVGLLLLVWFFVFGVLCGRSWERQRSAEQEFWLRMRTQSDIGHIPPREDV